MPSSSDDDDDEDDAEDGEAGAAAAAGAKARKAKPVYLRDVQAAQLLERAGGSDDEDGAAGGDDSDDSDEDGGGALGAPRGPTYAQEQEALRKEFLAVAADVGAGGDDADDADDAPADADAKRATAAGGGLRLKQRAAPSVAPPAGGRSAALLSSLFEAAPPAGDASADAFLRDYLTNQRWLEDGGEDDARRGGAKWGASGAADVAGASDGEAGAGSEEELERSEAFEAKFNFRFEEPGGATLAAQPRRTEGSIRKVKNARAEARKAKAERCVAHGFAFAHTRTRTCACAHAAIPHLLPSLSFSVAEEHAKLRAEVKRLKNLKRKEIEDKARSGTHPRTRSRMRFHAF
jgi:protein KRI1